MARGRPPEGSPRAAQSREYYLKNKERIAQYHKEWAKRNPQYQREYAARRAAVSVEQSSCTVTENPLLLGFRARSHD